MSTHDLTHNHTTHHTHSHNHAHSLSHLHTHTHTHGGAPPLPPLTHSHAALANISTHAHTSSHSNDLYYRRMPYRQYSRTSMATALVSLQTEELRTGRANYNGTATAFKVPRQTLRNLFLSRPVHVRNLRLESPSADTENDKNAIRIMQEFVEGVPRRTGKEKQLLSNEEEVALAEWVRTMHVLNRTVTRDAVLQKAREILWLRSTYKVLTLQWVDRFEKRYPQAIMKRPETEPTEATTPDGLDANNDSHHLQQQQQQQQHHGHQHGHRHTMEGDEDEEHEGMNDDNSSNAKRVRRSGIIEIPTEATPADIVIHAIKALQRAFIGDVTTNPDEKMEKWKEISKALDTLYSLGLLSITRHAGINREPHSIADVLNITDNTNQPSTLGPPQPGNLMAAQVAGTAQLRSPFPTVQAAQPKNVPANWQAWQAWHQWQAWQAWQAWQPWQGQQPIPVAGQSETGDHVPENSDQVVMAQQHHPIPLPETPNPHRPPEHRPLDSNQQ
jgi:hypothetical protein